MIHLNINFNSDFVNYILVIKIKIKEKMIPLIKINETKHEKLNVVVDGYEAEIFIQERFGSDKIVIIYKKTHPRFGEFFTTKYFLFTEPGIMSWGNNNEKMKITVV